VIPSRSPGELPAPQTLLERRHAPQTQARASAAECVLSEKYGAHRMTAQIGERLRYEGGGMTMATEPLETYFALGGEWPSFGFVSTALWRDYVGRW
jgi:hypothetical protein